MTVMRAADSVNPHERMAANTRSLASRTAPSASPTITKAGIPFRRKSASKSTRKASTPCNAPHANLTIDPVLWDVYGGVGSIGLYMGRNARVVGIEEMPGAVRYARGNAKALGRKAYKVEQGDAKSVLGRLVKLGPKPDVVVVDPPRAGIDAKVAQQLAEAAPLRLIYVSCNPATLARDVARLAPAFRLKAARPVDLFPQTPHVETVALLERA